MKNAVVAAALAFATTASARTFTVYNNCPFTIWYVSLVALVFVLQAEALQARCMPLPLFTPLIISPILSQMFTDLNVGSAVPNQPNGYVAHRLLIATPFS